VGVRARGPREVGTVPSRGRGNHVGTAPRTIVSRALAPPAPPDCLSVSSLGVFVSLCLCLLVSCSAL
jgi:hypothetical protein